MKQNRYFEGNVCTPMSITASFAIAKIYKEPKCLLTKEWIRKVCVCVCVCVYTHNEMLFSHKNEGFCHLLQNKRT